MRISHRPFSMDWSMVYCHRVILSFVSFSYVRRYWWLIVVQSSAPSDPLIFDYVLLWIQSSEATHHNHCSLSGTKPFWPLCLPENVNKNWISFRGSVGDRISIIWLPVRPSWPSAPTQFSFESFHHILSCWPIGFRIFGEKSTTFNFGKKKFRINRRVNAIRCSVNSRMSQKCRNGAFRLTVHDNSARPVKWICL